MGQLSNSEKDREAEREKKRERTIKKEKQWD